jgi:hypothetical protein
VDTPAAMGPFFLQLHGMTRTDRHEMIDRVQEAIARAGGYILDFHLFSNIAICLHFEVSAGKIGAFHASLASTGLRLDPASRDLLEGCSRQAEEAGAPEIAGTLSITFIHEEPDLRIEVPPIPG